jgi:hypothetical protein
MKIVINQKRVHSNLVAFASGRFSQSNKEPYMPSENSGSEEDPFGKLNPKIDPRARQVTDFLKHVRLFEEQNKDVDRNYFMEPNRLKGFATAEETERFYRRSQNDPTDQEPGKPNYNESLEVHHENFRSPFGSMLKLSTLAYGTYMGNPDDLTDYKMYDAIKQCVLSGGINHIDTAPNYRYMKSERTIGKILTTLESKYNIPRTQIFVATKAGYVPEDADNMILRTAMIQALIKDHKVPADSFQTESAHCMHPSFIERQL